MSRILRRPMFRGGLTNNGGIMSYAQPRKGYAGAGGVEDFNASDYYPSSSSVDGGLFGNNENEYVATSGKDESLSINPKFVKSETADIKQKNKTYKALGQDIEEGSYGDVLLKEYLGNRPDPMGKFLINFGLNYMSARPRGGKFGAFATAADAAKKPTEQLYADMDTDRLLKLKLMGALSKSESTGAFEKRVKAEFKYDQELPEGERRFKSLSDAARYVSRIDSEKKQETVEERIGKREQSIASKSITSDPLITRNQAEILERDKYKLGKDIEKLANKSTFDITDNLKQKPNSTDFTYPKASTGLLDSFKTGRIYVDADTRMSFEYMGNNIFRPVKKL
jgi:hypothetical protein